MAGFDVDVGGNVKAGLDQNTMIFVGVIIFAVVIAFGGCKK